MKFRMFEGIGKQKVAINVEQVKAVRQLGIRDPDTGSECCEVELLDGSTIDIAEHIFDVVSKLNIIAE